MKSRKDQLKDRGYFTKKDLEKYHNFSNGELLNLTKDLIPQKRAIAIHLLSFKNTSNNYTSYFLELFKDEKKLYVRLEIAKALKKGNIQTAKLMIPYLNKIPNNQYNSLPTKISVKKTYLIPRDLIGRILSKMDIAIFPLILELLKTSNLELLSESLDIFGFMIFHNQELATFENFKILSDLFEKYKSNDLILWKIVMVTSAFRNSESIDFLNNIKEFSSHEIIKNEVDRSIFLIEKNMD